MTQLRVLLTGRGSIARRHVTHLRALIPDLDLAIISSTRDVHSSFFPCIIFEHLEVALAWQPAAVVVASISSKHTVELQTCLTLGLPCLVEKPLAVSCEQLASLAKFGQDQATPTAVVVGCNLRYLPALQKLKTTLQGLTPYKVLRAHLEVGQALAQWRPQRELKTTYSANATAGGGVVFDLVHEIDMARWLLGPLQAHAAVGGHFSDLPIQADDVHVALLKTRSGAPVVVSLDYVSLQAVRRYAIVTDKGTFSADIVGKRIDFQTEKNRQILTDSVEDFDIQKTYASQMADWLQAIKNPKHQVMSGLADGLKTAELMLAMKKAAS